MMYPHNLKETPRVLAMQPYEDLSNVNSPKAVVATQVIMETGWIGSNCPVVPLSGAVLKADYKRGISWVSIEEVSS